MDKLSAVIITYNEEDKIRRCLDSVLEIADEIIVVDSFSTDATKKICESYSVVFIEQKFSGYIEQKQFAAEKSSNDYIFSLDADEFASDELIQSIKAEKQKGFSADGYIINRFNNYCGQWIRHGDYYPDKKLRIWKKGKGNWGGENPHDRVIMQPGAKTKFLQGNICHFSFVTLEEHITQMNKFSTLAAENMYRKGKKKSYFKLIANPAWEFFKGFIIKLGFLDGLAGFTIARVNAFYTFMKYIKLIRLYQKKNNE